MFFPVTFPCFMVSPTLFHKSFVSLHLFSFVIHYFQTIDSYSNLHKKGSTFWFQIGKLCPYRMLYYFHIDPLRSYRSKYSTILLLPATQLGTDGMRKEYGFVVLSWHSRKRHTNLGKCISVCYLPSTFNVLLDDGENWTQWRWVEEGVEAEWFEWTRIKNQPKRYKTHSIH